MDEYQEMLEGLIKNTGFELNSESKVLGSSDLKIRTPLEVINILLGGGIPMAIVAHSYGRAKCFTGDTRIWTIDGKCPTLKELYDQKVSKVGVYSCRDGVEPTVGLADYVEQTRVVDELVEVEIDGKWTIRCTTDHPFMLSDRSYKFAKDLQKSETLMSACRFSVSSSKGRVESYSISDRQELTYDLIKNQGTTKYWSELDHGLVSSNHTLVTDPRSHEITGVKVVEVSQEPMYAVINAGSDHNYVVSLNENEGVVVKNSGKSTLAYMIMGLFQKQFPDGVSMIIDMENSADPDRLRALGVDPDKVIRLPPASIEDGFIAIKNILKNKKNDKKLEKVPMYVIWDTIARGLAQTDQTQSRVNAYDRARIIKNYLGEIGTMLPRQPFVLWLLNQVVVSTDMYGNSKEIPGGGVALWHEVQFSLKIDSKDKSVVYDPTGTFARERMSYVTIDKTKASPEVKSIPMIIDVTKGGVVNELESYLEFLIDNIGWIAQSSGYYSLDPVLKQAESNPVLYEWCSKHPMFQSRKRWDTMKAAFYDDPALYDLTRVLLADYISSIYSLQSVIIKPYRDQIMKEFCEHSGVDYDLAMHPETISQVDDSEISADDFTDLNGTTSGNKEDNGNELE